MAKEVVETSKFNESWVGPFEIIRKNTGGAYLLRNNLGEQEPYRFPVDHLIRIEYYVMPDAVTAEVKRIIGKRGHGTETEYLVEWHDSTIAQQWLPVTAFDSLSPIQKFNKLQKKAVVDGPIDAARLALGDLRIHPDELLPNEPVSRVLPATEANLLPIEMDRALPVQENSRVLPASQNGRV